MSASVMYSTQRKGIHLSGDVHEIFKKKMQDAGGSEICIVKYDIEYYYLNGLVDANVKGALELFEFINKNGIVVLWLEY